MFENIDFFCLIIRPKVNAKKRMDMETGAVIKLRGTGSLKIVNTSDAADLCVYIQASSHKISSCHCMYG